MFPVFNSLAFCRTTKKKKTYTHRLRPLLLFSRDSSSVENFLSSFRELDCLLGFSEVEMEAGISSAWAIGLSQYFGNLLRFIEKDGPNNNKSSRKTLATRVWIWRKSGKRPMRWENNGTCQLDAARNGRSQNSSTWPGQRLTSTRRTK